MKVDSLLLRSFKILFFGMIFSSCFYLFYNQAYNDFPSDLVAHVGFIDDIVVGDKALPHPMFHYIVYFTAAAFGLSLLFTAVVVNSILALFLAVLLYKIFLLSVTAELPKIIFFLLVLIVFYSGTISFPNLAINKHHYLGNGSISIWHNVTLFMVKPFVFVSLFTLFYSFRFTSSKQNFLLATSAIVAVLSIFAKPSFIVIFLPVLFLFAVFFIIKREEYQFYLKVTLYFLSVSLIAIILLLYQFLTYYDASSSKQVILAPLVVLEHYSDNIGISLLTANLFVVLFSVICRKHLSIESIFSLLMLMVSILIFALFAEAGADMYAANFGWSYLLAQQVAYLFLIINFINKFNLIALQYKIVLIGSIGLQVFGGSYYLFKIMNGMSYY